MPRSCPSHPHVFCICPDDFYFILLRFEGPVYKLAFGPRSFIVVSDPVMAKHVLKSGVGDYDKGVLATVSCGVFCASQERGGVVRYSVYVRVEKAARQSGCRVV